MGFSHSLDQNGTGHNFPESIEIEVFCNRGRPTVAEVERKTLPSASPSADPSATPSLSGG